MWDGTRDDGKFTVFPNEDLTFSAHTHGQTFNGPKDPS